MTPDLLKWAASLGVGGILAAGMFWVYRKDMRDAERRDRTNATEHDDRRRARPGRDRGAGAADGGADAAGLPPSRRRPIATTGRTTPTRGGPDRSAGNASQSASPATVSRSKQRRTRDVFVLFWDDRGPATQGIFLSNSRNFESKGIVRIGVTPDRKVKQKR